MHKRRPYAAITPALLAAALLGCSAHLKAQVSESFLSEFSAELEAGQPALRLTKDGRVTHVETAIVINAPAEAVWNILVACEIAPEYVPNVVDCRSIEILDDGAAELFIQTVRAALFVTFEHVFRMDYMPHRRIDISRVSGPIRQLESTWELIPRSDGAVLLTYVLAVDPGIPIPRWFVRQTLRRDLPRVLEAVRLRATDAAAHDQAPR